MSSLLEAERRQVAVLFADMVGFTTFSEQFGEESAFRLMQRVSQLIEHAVTAEGAQIHNIVGDGVMVAFGAPAAIEDAPLRACRAALSILESLKSAGAEIEAQHSVRPEVRIGINAGPAVFGHLQAGGTAGLTVLGDTVNVAARLQALAEPGTALLSEAAWRLVDGMVDAAFLGDRPIKGRSATERIYRLDAVREQVSRFDVALSRGLTSFVGRDHELDVLEQCFDAIGGRVRVVDIVGEPGIGKSRLLHEFRAFAAQRRALMLIGHCTSDTQNTPFRVFIEIVRGAFRVDRGDDPKTIGSKLAEGLRGLGLSSTENLGLLLNLLGYEAPAGALSGLDGVLIGLGIRDLLRQIVQARSRLAPLILLFEDIHWLDNASQTLLGSLVVMEEPLRLMIVETRRPTSLPPWAEFETVTPLPLNALSPRETLRIAQTRLGVDQIPESLGALILSKAEGNALFVEEIVSFLLERGIVTVGAPAGLIFNSAAVTDLLPRNVQSILASRIDRLPNEARRLLQMAAVIGRRFDPDLVLALTDEGTEDGSSFVAMEDHDLIRRDGATGSYVFKHALLREVVYDGLLSQARESMHLKVAEELERRGSNAILERAESLAHHFASARNAAKALHYLDMAARKSLNIYAIEEAETYFRKALSLIDLNPTRADPVLAARTVVGLLETLLLKSDYRGAGVIAEKFMPVVRQAGETPELVKAYYYQTLSLVQRYELRAAHALMTDALAVAQRLGDGRARAYARAGLLHCRTRLGLDTQEEAELRRGDVMADCLRHGDNFLRNSAYFFVTWDYLYRGLIEDARALAIRLIASDEAQGDPRAIGFANWILGWINVIGGSADEAIGYANECLRVAIAPFDRLQGEVIGAVAAIFSGNAREGLAHLDALHLEFRRLGALYSLLDGPRGVALIELGRVSEGIRLIERTIVAREVVGDRTLASFTRILLAEVYIGILAGGRKATASVIIRNLPTLTAAKLRGARRAFALLEEAASHKQFSEQGAVFARIDFNRGQLWAMRGKPSEARPCFEHARAIAEAQGLEPLRRRSEAALARLA